MNDADLDKLDDDLSGYVAHTVQWRARAAIADLRRRLAKAERDGERLRLVLQRIETALDGAAVADGEPARVHDGTQDGAEEWRWFGEDERMELLLGDLRRRALTHEQWAAVEAYRTALRGTNYEAVYLYERAMVRALAAEPAREDGNG